jgi:hypothetical protein
VGYITGDIMISIICCSINAKFETEAFVRALDAHNDPGVSYEICLCHDNRVDDGSSEYFEKLQEEFPKLKIIENTKEDTVNYLEKVIGYYENHDIFPEDFRDRLSDNLELYREDKLFNPKESFLWLSSGLLYNKAVSISSGDILVVTPADYIYLFGLSDLEHHVCRHRKRGIFYGKFNGIMRQLCNRPLTQTLEMFERNTTLPDAFNTWIDYYPPTVNNMYMVDPITREAILLSDPNFLQKMNDLCCRMEGKPGKFARVVHGLHVMTRLTYDIIGGFTEEFYGRAWQDDKMNSHGMRLFWDEGSELPARFSFAWNPQASPLKGCPDPAGLLRVDPKYENHPAAGVKQGATYLHKGYDTDFIENLPAIQDEEFSSGGQRGRLAPVVRIGTK